MYAHADKDIQIDGYVKLSKERSDTYARAVIHGKEVDLLRRIRCRADLEEFLAEIESLNLCPGSKTTPADCHRYISGTSRSEFCEFCRKQRRSGRRKQQRDEEKKQRTRIRGKTVRNQKFRFKKKVCKALC